MNRLRSELRVCLKWVYTPVCLSVRPLVWLWPCGRLDACLCVRHTLLKRIFQIAAWFAAKPGLLVPPPSTVTHAKGLTSCLQGEGHPQSSDLHQMTISHVLVNFWRCVIEPGIHVHRFIKFSVARNGILLLFMWTSSSAFEHCHQTSGLVMLLNLVVRTMSPLEPQGLSASMAPCDHAVSWPGLALDDSSVVDSCLRGQGHEV